MDKIIFIQIVLGIIILILLIILGNILDKALFYKKRTNKMKEILPIIKEGLINQFDIWDFWKKTTEPDLTPKRNATLDQYMIERLQKPYKPQIKEFLNLGFRIEKIFVDEQGYLQLSKTDNVLKSKGYHWIVYIKLLNHRPFTVGKTGTKGSKDQRGIEKASCGDYDFMVGKNNDQTRNTPGRNFIKEYFPQNETCDCDFMLCINFDKEIDALNYEQFIAKNYHLYQS